VAVVAVDAPADSSLTRSASLRRIASRPDARVPAGTFDFVSDRAVSGWHHHDLHQVEYALEGVAEVETPTGRYLLPPQQSIWIPAGLEHNTILHAHVRTTSAFFDPSMVPDHVADRARVLAAAPVLREMIAYALRWPITRPATDRAADTYFAALATVVLDYLDREQPLSLPTTTDPLVAAVMAHTEAHLATVTTRHIRDELGVSERTLRRRFHQATGMTWRTYLLQARVMRAMTLLARPEATVLDVATTVGFHSPSSFTRAFRAWADTTPAAYRRRALER
jgi:AraC-like DNA-binding protein